MWDLSANKNNKNNPIVTSEAVNDEDCKNKPAYDDAAGLDQALPDFNEISDVDNFEDDFRNLQRFDSGKRSNDNDQSLNLGSAYSNNDYQFDDKVSSVQRDLSLDNCTDEYNSILNPSDMSNRDDCDRATSGRKFGKLSKAVSKANFGGLHSMARIKSSVKLFTVDTNAVPDNEDELELGGKLIRQSSRHSTDSENISDLSTGDSAYPVVAFKARVVKEFEPKVSIYLINKRQMEIQNAVSRVPKHTKLQYEAPIESKIVQSPPLQSSFDK